jgi:hypothetical protein
MKMCDYNTMLDFKDIQIGDLLELKGISRHGKNRIDQHGNTWRVIRLGHPFRPNGIGLESLEETFGGFADGRRVKDGRWITIHNDPNFETVRKVA